MLSHFSLPLQGANHFQCGYFTYSLLQFLYALTSRAQVVDSTQSVDSSLIEAESIELENASDSTGIERVNDPNIAAPTDSTIDSGASQATIQPESGSATRSSWYEISEPSDSITKEDSLIRERGSPDSIRAKYSTPLMPDLQSAQPSTKPSALNANKMALSIENIIILPSPNKLGV